MCLIMLKGVLYFYVEGDVKCVVDNDDERDVNFFYVEGEVKCV